MQLYPTDQRPAPLLAPQFTRSGPYSPGETLVMEVPLSNESGVTMHDLSLRFVSDTLGVRFDPMTVDISELRVGETKRLPSKVTFPEQMPDLQRVLTAQVWAVVETGETPPFETARAAARIETRANIIAEIVDQSLLIENLGTADATLRFECDTTLPALWPQTLAVRAKTVANPIDLPSTPLGPIRIINDEEGERLVVLHRRVAPEGPKLQALAETREPVTGVRSGDLVPFEVQLLNTGTTAYDVKVELPALVGVLLADGYTTRDDVPLLPQDIKCGKDTWTFAVGALRSNEKTTLRGAIRVVDPPTGIDVLDWHGSVMSGEARATVRFTVRLLQTPLIAPHSTYFGPLREIDNERLTTELVITHPHKTPIRSASLAISVHGAQIESLFDTDGAPLQLVADALGEAGTIAEVGTIAAQSRVRYVLTLVRLPSASRIEATASLIADGRTMDLAEMGEDLFLEPRPTISLDVPDNGRLCRGAPLHVKVVIRNDGTDNLRAVRIRPAFPPGIGIKFPHKSTEGDWRVLGFDLPPGVKMDFPAVLTLTEPPENAAVTLTLEVDGENAARAASAQVEVSTPSSPLLICSEPEFLDVEDRGLLEVRVRVMNRSDGIARGVVVMVASEDNPVPFTATLDGNSVDERGHSRGSVLVEGIYLGDMRPNSQHDIAWYAAPGANCEVYHTTVTVRADGGIERQVRGAVDATVRQRFATAPPPAAPINEAQPIAGVNGRRATKPQNDALAAANAHAALGPSNERSAASSNGSANGSALSPTQEASPDIAHGEVIPLSTTIQAKVTAAEPEVDLNLQGGDTAGDEPERLLAEAPAATAPAPDELATHNDDEKLSKFLSRVSTDGNQAKALPTAQGDDDEVFVTEVASDAHSETSTFDRLDALLLEAQASGGGLPAAETLVEPAPEVEPEPQAVADVEPELEVEAEPQPEPVAAAAPILVASPAVATAFGFTTVSSFIGLVPAEHRARAAIQMIAVRLIGPDEYDRLTIARKVFSANLGPFATARKKADTLELWCKDTIRRIDEAIANTNGGGVADPIADNDAIGGLSWVSDDALPETWRQPYLTWRTLLESTLPLENDDAIGYTTLLWATPVPEIDEALGNLLKVATA